MIIVKALYSKSAGKGGKYSSVTEKSNIGAISYLVVQVFEPVTGTGSDKLEFQSKTDRMALLQTDEFAFIPSFCFLTMLSTAPILANSGSFTIGQADCAVFKGWAEHENLVQMTRSSPNVNRET